MPSASARSLQPAGRHFVVGGPVLKAIFAWRWVETTASNCSFASRTTAQRSGYWVMIVIVGCIVVIGAVLGGFIMAGGHIGALIHPTEVLTIGGAALGGLIVSSPKKVLIDLMKGILARSKARRTRRPTKKCSSACTTCCAWPAATACWRSKPHVFEAGRRAASSPSIRRSRTTIICCISSAAAWAR